MRNWRWYTTPCRASSAKTSNPDAQARTRAGHGEGARPVQKDDAAAIDAVTAYIIRNPRHGFDKLHDSFRAQCQPWGKTVLLRVYCALRLNLPRRGKKAITRTDPGTAGSAGTCQRSVVDGLHVGCALIRPSLPHLQCHRRLQPGVAAHRHRYQSTGCTGDPCLDRTDGGARQAATDTGRQ